MNPNDKASFRFHPFQKMKGLLEDRQVDLPAARAPAAVAVAVAEEKVTDGVEEQALFREAMQGVRAIPHEGPGARKAEAKRPVLPGDDPDAEVLALLDQLVQGGQGFIVSDTPEYIEGTGYDIPPFYAERLHRGDFPVQAHLDLHGQNVEDARVSFDGFLKWAVKKEKRVVLIIHGRGRSSPAEPVLKNKVVEWLTCRSWRKWVVAFTSARLHDGGAGATYVLLRSHPVAKRFRKKAK